MVPTSGPHNKAYQFTVPVYGGCVVRDYAQTSYRQRRGEPYLPLNYSLDSRQVTKALNPNLPGWPGNLGAGVSPSFQVSATYDAENKARAKLVDALGEQSLWAVNIAEAKKSLGLITGPVASLISMTRKIRRFDFDGALLELNQVNKRRNLRQFPTGMKMPKGLRATSKAFANNWLAFHFGWEPLIKDIGAGITTLTNPYPPVKVFGKGSGRMTYATDSGGQFWTKNWIDIRSYVRCGATVTVNNPNLYLAQQLGFVNPLSVAWELVPFSFVVDWFVNVGQVLGQMTEFAGLTLSESYLTRFQVMTTRELLYFGQYQFKEGYFVRRAVPMSAYTSLRVRHWKGVSATRGATAVSLLVQLMNEGKSYR